jgi:hypothetical protein
VNEDIHHIIKKRDINLFKDFKGNKIQAMIAGKLEDTKRKQ